MNCTICGKGTLPGAMLCGPCKAALKRARYVTVQDDIRRSSIIDVRRKPRRPRSTAAASANAVPIVEPGPIQIPSRPPEANSNRVLGRRIYVGVFIVALALVGASYFGQRELGARAQDAVSVPRDLLSPSASESTVQAAASAPKIADPAPSQAASAVPSATVADAAPEHAAAAKVASPAKRAAPRTAASFATANGDPPEAVSVPPPEPEKVVAALPVAPPPPVIDRWQSMRDSIASCDRENLINGIICGQKVRIQYCEGYWGKVPQCPGPTANPER